MQRPVAVSGDIPQSNEQIEELLNRILEKTEKWDQLTPATAPKEGESVAVNSTELETAKKELAKLKESLEAKERELAEARKLASASSAESTSPSSEGAGEGNNKEYLEKIAELETKLAEYEVLEDDIADLSLYKEENARLKKEVERLKGGEDSSDEAAPSIPEPDSSDDLVREFAEAVGKEPVVESNEESAPQEQQEDLSAASSEEAPEPQETPGPETPEPQETPAQEPQEASGSKEVDDLFAELASSDLDTDKVVSELAEIENMAAAATSEEALSEDLDPDKIAEEASEFKS